MMNEKEVTEMVDNLIKKYDVLFDYERCGRKPYDIIREWQSIKQALLSLKASILMAFSDINKLNDRLKQREIDITETLEENEKFHNAMIGEKDAEINKLKKKIAEIYEEYPTEGYYGIVGGEIGNDAEHEADEVEDAISGKLSYKELEKENADFQYYINEIKRLESYAEDDDDNNRENMREARDDLD